MSAINAELFSGLEALTYDDLLIVPGWSEVLPDAVSTETNIGGIKLQVPFFSAAMDTVTEAPLAVALAREGGIGVLHRNLSIQDQAKEVDTVKRAQAGMITDPVSLRPNASLAEAEELMAHHKISGIPITDESGKLVGVLTNRDIRFCDQSQYHMKVSNFMTSSDLITAPVGTSVEKAKDILHKYRIEKLPLVDDNYNLKGLITVKDITKRIEKPKACLDEEGRLRVGAAIGVNDALDRAEALVDVGVDLLVVDTAHGHTLGVVDTVKNVKSRWDDVLIIAGNVVTSEGVKSLVDAGANAVKVGVGAGSICTTRVVSGAGMPQMTAIYNCSTEADKLGVPVIADGGIVSSGDIVKSFAAGASAVMLGNSLAGADESPGELELIDGAMWKTYRGMGSSGAMRGRASDRYLSASNKLNGKHVPEGVEARVRYAGSLSELIAQLLGGLTSGMGYAGASTIDELRNETKLLKVTGAGLRESHPHDVQVVREE